MPRSFWSLPLSVCPSSSCLPWGSSLCQRHLFPPLTDATRPAGTFTKSQAKINLSIFKFASLKHLSQWWKSAITDITWINCLYPYILNPDGWAFVSVILFSGLSCIPMKFHIDDHSLFSPTKHSIIVLHLTKWNLLGWHSFQA